MTSRCADASHGEQATSPQKSLMGLVMCDHNPEAFKVVDVRYATHMLYHTAIARADAEGIQVYQAYHPHRHMTQTKHAINTPEPPNARHPEKDRDTQLGNTPCPLKQLGNTPAKRENRENPRAVSTSWLAHATMNSTWSSLHAVRRTKPQHNARRISIVNMQTRH